MTLSPVDQFKDPKTEVVLWPPQLKTGDVVYPHTDPRYPPR
jgi:branched-chain amino acid transport system substrate-binding protein